MKTKLFDYVERDNYVFNLSGLTKITCFFLLTFAVMFSYDIRFVLTVLVLSFIILKVSGITFQQIKLMLIYVFFFLLLNFVLTFVFSPTYGVDLYGTRHVLIAFSERYVVTLEQLLYQITKTTKYASVVPLGIIFLLTTNPSEFAASVNRVGIPYKISYAFSLTLRYFPDLIRDYNDISAAQQCRGLDLSKKEKFTTRVKNVMTICIPLVFSTLDRIEMVSNTMDLRSFGKSKKRTWYSSKPLYKGDILALVFCSLVFGTSISISVFLNESRFFNPFI